MNFAKRALLTIAAALTLVGVGKMVDSYKKYGTHEFWSAERKAKGAVKKSVSEFEKKSQHILKSSKKK